jgi:hypothetical protein
MTSRITELQQKLARLWPHLDERARRMVAAAEARQIGYGGISRVSRACGLSRVTIAKGVRELESGITLPTGRTRRPGGGRPRLVDAIPDFPDALEALLEPLTRGDSVSPLRWTCKSTRVLAKELTESNRPVSHEKVAQILRGMGYNLQDNRKVKEGKDSPDRHAQFQYINDRIREALHRGNPVISVHARRTSPPEYSGDTAQRQLPKEPQIPGAPALPDSASPQGYAHGIYDVARRNGLVSIQTDCNAGSFAAASIKGWWRHEGQRLYAGATEIVIALDATNIVSASNRSQLDPWKVELQNLANASGLPLLVCHFPPGTSKWNKATHRLFSFVASNRLGEPLRDFETTVCLVAARTAPNELKGTCRLDRRNHVTMPGSGTRAMVDLNLIPQVFHGEWNYIIRPKNG